jgi:hypothetical protein
MIDQKNQSDGSQLAQGYGYIYSESDKIIEHHIIIDTIQDSLMALAFKNLLGLSFTDDGVHKWLHQMAAKLPFEAFKHNGCCVIPENVIKADLLVPGAGFGKPNKKMRTLINKQMSEKIVTNGLNTDRLNEFAIGFKHEYFLHAGVKFIAVMSFPVVYEAYRYSEPTLKPFLAPVNPNIVYDAGHFVLNATLANFVIDVLSVAPLTAISIINPFANTALGDHSFLSKVTHDIAYRPNFHEDRAIDIELQKRDQFFNFWMKCCDAALHFGSDWSMVIANQGNSPYGISIWVFTRISLWYAITAFEANSNKKIESIRQELINKDEIDYCPVEAKNEDSWAEWLDEGLGFLGNVVKVAGVPYLIPLGIAGYNFMMSKYQEYNHPEGHNNQIAQLKVAGIVAITSLYQSVFNAGGYIEKVLEEEVNTPPFSSNDLTILGDLGSELDDE